MHSNFLFVIVSVFFPLSSANIVKLLHEQLNTTCFPKLTENARGVWVKENSDIIVSPRDNVHLIRDFNSTVDNHLYISALTIEDSGTYTCYDRGLKVRSFTMKVLGK